MSQFTRRALLTSTAVVLFIAPALARAASIKGGLPWSPGRADPPEQVRPGPWHYFTADEGAAIEAMVDRLIPADADTPGGKDVGCAVYIDRQLAGPFGRYAGRYMSGPFRSGTEQQGPQSSSTPATIYRKGLAALDAHCRKVFDGKRFVDLADADKDALLSGLEDDKVKLEGADGHGFFEQLIKDTQQGFFADPIYGANKDMAAWRMIGFPGARYDYRDWVERHNERFPLPPVSISQHPSWSQ